MGNETVQAKLGNFEHLQYFLFSVVFETFWSCSHFSCSFSFVHFRSASVSTDSRNLDNEIKTSEYGSADPSPTDSSQSAATPCSDADPSADYKAQVC